jgi:glucans biosynthesis protein C
MQESENLTAAVEKPRTEFIDHLRVLLTVLVVFHHAAICYGAPGGWYYHERSFSSLDPITAFCLTMFCATNQAFFMGFFFLLAGYFTPASLDKKGYRSFLTDRLIRLGIPFLLYGFLISPLTIALAAAARGESFLKALVGSSGQFHAGPLWFAEALLIFSAIYVLFCMLAKKFATQPGQDKACAKDASLKPDALPGHLMLLFSALAVGAVSMLIRLWYPIGKEFLWLQLGFFSSYTLLFYLGCHAWHHRWLEKIEARLALPWLLVSLAALSGFAFTAISVGFFTGARVDLSGGLNLFSVVHAFEEPLVAWGMILALLWLFRLKFNQHSQLGHELAQRAYAIYIIHPPILVGISFLLQPWQTSPLLKFPVAASLAFCCCALVAGLLLKSRAARRVIG